MKDGRHRVLRKYMVHDHQYLDSERVYSLNRVLGEICDELGISNDENVVIVPIFYHMRKRSHHSACLLGDGVWGPTLSVSRESEEIANHNGNSQSEGEFLSKLLFHLSRIACCATFQDEFVKARENLLDGNAYSHAANTIDDYLESIIQWFSEETSSIQANIKLLVLDDDDESKDIFEDIIYKPLAIHLGLLCESEGPLGRREYEKQRELIRALHLFYHSFRMHRMLYLFGIFYRGLERYSGEGQIEYYLGVPKGPQDNRTASYEGKYYFVNGEPTGSSVELQGEGYCIDSTGKAEIVTNDEVAEARGMSVFFELAHLFYLDYLSELERKQTNKDAGKGWTSDGPVLILPIHNLWLGGIGFGGIWGVLLLTFKPGDFRRTFIQESLNQLLPRCEALADELFEAGLSAVSDEEVRPPYDLVEHFVRTITLIQDWESIAVYKDNGSGRTLMYCYLHVLEDAVISGYKWVRCNDKNDSTCSKCNRRHGGGKVLRWEDNEDLDIWSRELLPELHDDELERYRDITVEFEYPQTVHVPTKLSNGDETPYHFNIAIIKQQLVVLQLLIPKLRARRYALRSAAVSIMGRNMSHNIGSHVLARYSACGDEQPKTVKQFTRYLQERMDFIADLSTTDVFYTLPTKFYGETMMGLVGDPYKQDKMPRQEILLKYISGLKDVDVAFENKNNKYLDVTYSSPAGRLGMQALYVILENIARNAAKHGSSISEQEEITVSSDVNNNVRMCTLEFTLNTLPHENSEMSLSCNMQGATSTLAIDYINVNSSRQNLNDSRPVQNMFSGTPWLLKDDDGIKIGKNLIVIRFRSTDWQSSSLSDSKFVLMIQDKKRILLNIKFSENHQHQWKDEFIEVLVWDNLRNCQSGDKKQWYPDWINNILKTPFITDSGEIEPKYWGIREMFLAAAYLREIPMNDLESRRAWPSNDRNRPNILECVAVDDNHTVNTGSSSERNLGYRFYLKRRLLLVEFHDEGDTWAKENDLLGINLLPIADGIMTMTHSYGIFPEGVYSKLTEDRRLRLPVMWFDKNKDSDYLRNFEANKAEELLAKAWWRKHLKERIGYSGEDDPYKLFCTGDYTDNDSLNTISTNDLRTILRANGEGSKKLLVFEHHKRLADNELDKFGFYEPFRSEHPQSTLIHDKNEDKREFYQAMFKTAALTRILLVDERIQAMQSIKQGDLGFELLFPLMGIVIPPIGDVDLDKIDQKDRNFFTWLSSLVENKSEFRKNGKAYDFIVIHQGIIDKLRKVVDNFDSKFKEKAAELGCDGRIIVCSGRGDPRDSLPKYARFTPISGILEWTINNPSKFHLVHLLCHARRPG